MVLEHVPVDVQSFLKRASEWENIVLEVSWETDWWEELRRSKASGSKSMCDWVSQPPRRLWYSIAFGLRPRLDVIVKSIPQRDRKFVCDVTESWERSFNAKLVFCRSSNKLGGRPSPCNLTAPFQHFLLLMVCCHHDLSRSSKSGKDSLQYGNYQRCRLCLPKSKLLSKLGCVISNQYIYR